LPVFETLKFTHAKFSLTIILRNTFFFCFGIAGF